VVPGAAGGVRGATPLAPVRTTPEVRLDGRPAADVLVEGLVGALEATGAAEGATDAAPAETLDGAGATGALATA
jgi:hypothetical protein